MRAAGGAGLPAALHRKLAALPDGPIRERAAARALASMEPAFAARTLEAALRSARLGSADEAGVAWALCQAVQPEMGIPYEQLAEIYREARERDLLAAALLLAPLPHRVAPRGNPSSARAGELSLGHRRALARTISPTVLDRLAADADAGVVRELLRNPRLTEREVLRLATRRPARQDVLEVIATSRFAQRTAVRTALARNPYCPPSLALKLLAHLPGRALGEMAADGTLHPEIQRLAACLHALGE
ncbi:MAG: hypothetical protein ACYDCL_05285 [Myxococcales bacterium]